MQSFLHSVHTLRCLVGCEQMQGGLLWLLLLLLLPLLLLGSARRKGCSGSRQLLLLVWHRPERRILLLPVVQQIYGAEADTGRPARETVPHVGEARLEYACRKLLSSDAGCDHRWWRSRRSALVALQAKHGLEQAANVHHGRRDGQAQQHRQQQAQDGRLAVAHGPAHPVCQGVEAAVTVRHLAHNRLPHQTSDGVPVTGVYISLILQSFTSHLS